MPVMLVMLQSPSEQIRVRAVQALTRLPAEASTAMTTAILSSPVDILGHLLTLLSGDDTTASRSWYAALTGRCALMFDPPGLKRISDAGAVPYLLKLLKEAEGDWPKIRTLECLSVSCQSHQPPLHSIVTLHTSVGRLCHASIFETRCITATCLPLLCVTAQWQLKLSTIQHHSSKFQHTHKQLHLPAPAFSQACPLCLGPSCPTAQSSWLEQQAVACHNVHSVCAPQNIAGMDLFCRAWLAYLLRWLPA